MAKTRIVPDHIADIICRSVITKDSVTLPPGQLDPKIYREVDQVLKDAGGKWSIKTKSHLFPKDPRQALQGVLNTGTIAKSVNQQQLTQQFYTPVEIARQVVELACVHSDHTVLEPSAGTGRLIDALFEELPEFPPHQLTMVETDRDSCKLLRERWPAATLHEKMFEDTRFSKQFDRVIMNPPFTRGTDAKHLEQAYLWLKPGGTLVAICSNGSKAQEKALALDRAATIIPLGEGAFAESGTRIRTNIFVLEKT